MNSILIGVAVGLGCSFLFGCATAPQHVMDSQELCMLKHMEDTTGTGWGMSLEQCASIRGWSQERRNIDG